MKAKPTPPFLRRRLGRRLRTMREAAGLSMEKAAELLDTTRTSLFRVETGETKASVHLVRSMMDLYDRWEEGLLDQTREARKPLWFHPYGLADVGYVDVETYARAVHEFGGLNLPGLLQTESYVRALLAGSRLQRTAAQS